MFELQSDKEEEDMLVRSKEGNPEEKPKVEDPKVEEPKTEERTEPKPKTEVVNDNSYGAEANKIFRLVEDRNSMSRKAIAQSRTSNRSRISRAKC